MGGDDCTRSLGATSALIQILCQTIAVDGDWVALLPNFICIGAQRAGTTWLYRILESHPQVFVPVRRKEIHFFDWYYERGIEWYGKFFPSGSQSHADRAVGEVTPDYLYEDRCPARIREILPDVKLIVILRNPVDRAYSHYRMVLRDGIFTDTFEEVVYGGRKSIGKEIIERGFYSRFVENYLRVFERDELLILVFERAVKDSESTKRRLASFLGLDARLFPSDIGGVRINPVTMPKARKAYAFAKKSAEKLRKLDIDWMVNLAKDMGVQRFFGVTGELPPLEDEVRAHLTDLYRSDTKRLESMLQLDLAEWYSGG